MSVPPRLRYSVLYPQGPSRNTEHFRVRLQADFSRLIVDAGPDFTKYLMREGGIRVPSKGDRYFPEKVFTDCVMSEVLDAVTLFFNYCRELSQSPPDGKRTTAQKWATHATNWLQFVSRVMEEENVGYFVDDACVARKAVSDALDRNRVAATEALRNPALSVARKSLETAFHHLRSRDRLAAISCLFSSVEHLVKQIVPSDKPLSYKLVGTTFKRTCLRHLGGNGTEQEAFGVFLDSFALWVRAIEPYQAKPPPAQPAAPSYDLAVFILSSGSAYVRLLAKMVLLSAKSA